MIMFGAHQHHISASVHQRITLEMATTTATTRLSRAEVLQLAKEVKEKSKKITIDPLVMASIAMIESSGDPKAYRFEPHLVGQRTRVCLFILMLS